MDKFKANLIEFKEIILDILFFIKIKSLAFLRFLKGKLSLLWDFIYKKVRLSRLIPIILVVIIIFQGIASVVITSSVLSDGGLADKEKKEKLFHVQFSDKKYIEWLNKRKQGVGIRVKDDKDLKAVKISNYSTSHTYVIMAHPYGKGVDDMAKYAHHFHDMGFHVYLPYMRGFGSSEHKDITMGYEDSNDLVKWAHNIASKDDRAIIYFFGVGLGGTASLFTANKEIPSNVKGIIADSAYSDVEGLFKHNIKTLYKLPSFPYVQVGSFYNKAVNGWAFDEINVMESVKNSKVPIFYIQGGEDQVVPPEQINDLYDNTTVENSDHLLISGATHGETLSFSEEKYWDNVDLFILNTMD